MKIDNLSELNNAVQDLAKKFHLNHILFVAEFKDEDTGLSYVVKNNFSNINTMTAKMHQFEAAIKKAQSTNNQKKCK